MFQSATKIVLILMSLTISIALFLRILDPKDYMVIAIMVFTFYYSKPVEQPVNGNVH
jgi:hypothetical protein